MIFKIDLEKAYDKITWKFLKDTSQYFNFSDLWIDLIMNCLSNVSTSIIWNGEPPLNFHHKGDSGKEILYPHTCLFFVWKDCLI